MARKMFEYVYLSEIIDAYSSVKLGISLTQNVCVMQLFALLVLWTKDYAQEFQKPNNWKDVPAIK